MTKYYRYTYRNDNADVVYCRDGSGTSLVSNVDRGIYRDDDVGNGGRDAAVYLRDDDVVDDDADDDDADDDGAYDEYVVAVLGVYRRVGVS